VSDNLPFIRIDQADAVELIEISSSSSRGWPKPGLPSATTSSASSAQMATHSPSYAPTCSRGPPTWRSPRQTSRDGDPISRLPRRRSSDPTSNGIRMYE
jgi:hypothetical protein